jgi:hypothetical protein
MIRKLLHVLLIAAASPALAQEPAALPEGRFLDKFGRTTELMLGLPGLELVAGEHSIEVLAAEFKRICVDTKLDRTAFAAAAQSSPLNLKANPFRYTFGRKEELSLDFDGWQSADVGVRLVDFKNYFVKGLQCNLTAAVKSPTDWRAVSRAAAVVSGLDPADPVNAKALKNGVFEVPVTGGTLLLVGAVGESSSHAVVHFGALLRPNKQ